MSDFRFPAETKAPSNGGKENPSRVHTAGEVVVAMQFTSEKSARPDAMLLGLSSRIRRVTRVLGAFSLFALCHHPEEALSQATPDSYSVALAWDPSLSTEAVSYNLHYGGASQVYTNRIALGNVTSVEVSGLASGSTYFFAVTAVDAAGLESDFSDEISYVPGLPSLRLLTTPTRLAILTLKGLLGHSYGIEATQDFKTWTVVGTVAVGIGGSVDFIDLEAANYPSRFYRTLDIQR